MKEKIIFNWSSGKDSALCLYKILQKEQDDVMCLLTSISEKHQRISMHGVRIELLDAQADSIGIPLIKMQIPEMPTMEDYETVMRTTLTGLINNGATASAFGDIFLEDLRIYRETKLSELNLKGIFPLWKISTDKLIQEFIDLGFKAIVTCVNEKYLDKSFAGRMIDYDFLNDLPDDVDPCGENGEFHTFVFNGPIFKEPIAFDKGEIVYRKYSAAKEKDDSTYNCNTIEKDNAANPFDYGFWYCDLLLQQTVSTRIKCQALRVAKLNWLIWIIETRLRLKHQQRSKIKSMRDHVNKKIFIVRTLILFLLTLQISSYKGQVEEYPINHEIGSKVNNQPLIFKRNTIFPQIHTNLNGMVQEFVRTMYQDKKGNYWFGTNGNGLIRYNGQALEKIIVKQDQKWVSVRDIVEDKDGNVWFGTSSGLVKYDGEKFTTYSTEVGLQNEEIWGLTVDTKGLIWVGSIGGVSHFDGKKFKPFNLPETMVENPQHMLSDKLVKRFMEDKNGIMWMVTDGNGIFKFDKGEFTHLTNKNGLTDNNAADILEDKQGNIWIGTFYGGVSKFDGKTYTNFTKDGNIEGVETYNFCEDSHGNIWFSAENHGVYRYDGASFTQFTTANGLTTNGVQSIFEDNKGQLWFGTWQGICLYDGQKFMNANEKEPWTN